MTFEFTAGKSPGGCCMKLPASESARSNASTRPFSAWSFQHSRAKYPTRSSAGNSKAAAKSANSLLGLSFMFYTCGWRNYFRSSKRRQGELRFLTSGIYKMLVQSQVVKCDVRSPETTVNK